MKAFFGEGLHPNADAIAAYVTNAECMASRPLRPPSWAASSTSATAKPPSPAPWRWPTATTTRKPARTGTRPSTRPPAPRSAPSSRAESSPNSTAAPADDRELTGYIARETRARTTAVAGYDLTFSPVKSVSALWAIAPMDVAAVVEECHDAAVADALKWLETHAAFTRSGTNGVAQVDTTGLLGAAFTHRDSRAGDPDLHTHVAISNKVATVDAAASCAGWRSTASPCTGSPWPPPSCTTPAWKPTLGSVCRCGSPTCPSRAATNARSAKSWACRPI